MKPEQLYQTLKEVAEKLGITVSERSFQHTGMTIRSGLCRVRGKLMFVMDKHLPVHKKNQEIAACLCRMPIEEIYLVPAVREFLNKPIIRKGASYGSQSSYQTESDAESGN